MNYGRHSYHSIFVRYDKRGTSAPYRLFSRRKKSLFETSQGGSAKFLGFMVTQRGIEVKAIMDSQAPTSKKGLQQLTSRPEALGRFISRFIDQLKPFFITIRGAKRAGWNEESDQAFAAIK